MPYSTLPISPRSSSVRAPPSPLSSRMRRNSSISSLGYPMPSFTMASDTRSLCGSDSSDITESSDYEFFPLMSLPAQKRPSSLDLDLTETDYDSDEDYLLFVDDEPISRSTQRTRIPTLSKGSIVCAALMMTVYYLGMGTQQHLMATQLDDVATGRDALIQSQERLLLQLGV